jgi:hypothetical protein
MNIPTPEVTESDFGAFQEEARERPAPIRTPEDAQAFLDALYERAQRQRFAQTEAA